MGRGHSDRVKGGSGDDTIRIKSEAGSFWGGSDDDLFVLKNSSADIQIMDFDRSDDRIDLRPALLSLLDGDQAKLEKFGFVGADDFSKSGFELGFQYEQSDGREMMVLTASIRGHEFDLLTLSGFRDIGCDALIF